MSPQLVDRDLLDRVLDARRDTALGRQQQSARDEGEKRDNSEAWRHLLHESVP
jgi:hypothetical protein